MGNFREGETPLLEREEASFTVLDLKIDRGILPCASGSGSKDEEIRLFKYGEIPQFLQGNPYVLQGYRVLLPAGMCIKSLCMWNNETVNIWTHLLGFVLFVVLAFYDNIHVIPEQHGDWADHVIITSGLICYQFCMICSAGYHIFNCHSERANSRWLAVDLTGISIGLIGCYIPGVYYAFYCQRIWRDFYLMVVSVLLGISLFLQLHPRFFSREWTGRRLFLYCSLAAYGVIPTCHWAYLNGGWSHKLIQLFIPKVTVMYILGILAFTFYITKFPERCFPGKVDFIGSSHQWWHIIVVLAFYHWHRSGQEILHYWSQNPCIS